MIKRIFISLFSILFIFSFSVNAVFANTLTGDDEESLDFEDPELREVFLPQVTTSEATCINGESSLSGYSMTITHGITFDTEGGIDAGETLKIIATPDENIKLVENHDWIVKDNVGIYEHTFDELDCSEDEDESDEEDDGSEDDDKYSYIEKTEANDDKSDGTDKSAEKAEDGSKFKENEEVQEDRKLPNTATSTFNWLLVGVGALSVGGFGMFLTRKKKTAINK